MKYLIALGLVATLTACSGNGNHASKRELGKAIDDFNSKHPLCVPVNNALAGQAGNTAHLIKGRFGDEWVHITTENLAGDDINKGAQQQMKIMTREGLYEKAGSKEQKAVLGDDIKIPTDSFRLTKEGKAQFRSSAYGNLMCIGHVKVDEVVWFTEPTPANGMTVTQVRFKPEYKLESFAKKLLKEDLPELKQELENEQDLTATLVQTNEGWRDIRELAAPKR